MIEGIFFDIKSRNQGINISNKGGVFMGKLHKFLRLSGVLLFAIIFLASCDKSKDNKENQKGCRRESDTERCGKRKENFQ